MSTVERKEKHPTYNVGQPFSEDYNRGYGSKGSRFKTVTVQKMFMVQNGHSSKWTRVKTVTVHMVQYGHDQ